VQGFFPQIHERSPLSLAEVVPALFGRMFAGVGKPVSGVVCKLRLVFLSRKRVTVGNTERDSALWVFCGCEHEYSLLSHRMLLSNIRHYSVTHLPSSTNATTRLIVNRNNRTEFDQHNLKTALSCVALFRIGHARCKIKPESGEGIVGRECARRRSCINTQYKDLGMQC